MRIGVVRVAALPPEVAEAVLRAEEQLNAELERLLPPEALAALDDARVEFDVRPLREVES